MRWRLTILSCSSVALLATTPPKDLDVGVPPGSPTSWAGRFPSITPRPGPLFPVTPSGKAVAAADKAKKIDPTRTVVQTPTAELNVTIASSFGVVRILTWDILAHLRWLSQTPKNRRGPVTGATARLAALPPINDGLYWANMASLLRLMLHPQLVSESELIAHLCEIGEPVLKVLGVAVAERSLAAPCNKLAKLITAPRSAAKPLAGATPRATMLKRFLAEELVAVHPFDPEGGFGQRFLLFADEVEPYLVQYAAHPDSFLRRNAVAALGRYRTDSAMSALAEVVAHTKDAVVLMRSLSALGAYRTLRQRDILLNRLSAAKEPVEKVALVVALGRVRSHEAVPALLKLVSKKRDPDLLQAVVAALARIRPRSDAKVLKFAQRTAKAARSKPSRFAVKSRGGPKADIPDSAETRGQVIEQLTWILLARLDHKDHDTKARLLALVPSAKAARARGNRRALFRNQTLAAVKPPVQILFLETLRELGDPGVAALRRIAADKTVEPALRGQALANMPFHDRGAAAVAILDAKGEATEAKIYALEVIANDGHDRLQAIAGKLLEECGKAKAASGAPELRYLWLQALRALDRRHLLKTDDILPLMTHPNAHVETRDDVHRMVRDMVMALVEDAAADYKRKTMLRRIDKILAVVIAQKVNPRITAATLDQARQQILVRLPGLKGHRADRRYKDQVIQEVLHYLLGFKLGFTLRDRTQFKPVVLLDREILFALGRTKTDAAAAALTEFLAAHPDSVLRGYACLALGMTGRSKSAGALVDVLGEAHGFTRFCAYEALRHLLGADFFADWIYGSAAAHTAAQRKYRETLEKR